MRTAVLTLSLLCSLMVVAIAQQPSHERLSLWSNGAPGSAARRSEPEQAKDYWVKNVHDPSVDVYLPPPEKATGAAVVVVPGGGHRLLVYNAEGSRAWPSSWPTSALPHSPSNTAGARGGSTYTIEGDAVADTYRALRLVRSRAAEWHIDPHRVGVMGFSAGGELVGMVAFPPGEGNAQAPDPVDRLSGRPDFAIFIYPGPLAVPASVPSNAPPAFLAAASDDPCCGRRSRSCRCVAMPACPSRRTSPRRGATASTWASGRS
jgi:acetyl esterase/lipase